MSRPLRIEYPGACYHVMNRGRRSETIFSEKQDYRLFIDLLIEISEMWDVKVAAYCLMTNHYHVVLQTPEGNLSRCMRHLNGIYTQTGVSEINPPLSPEAPAGGPLDH